MNEAKVEAVANADACTNNSGLPTYTELLAELKASHTIIRNALSIMTTEQKAAWGKANARDDVDGEGVTRANEREAIFAKA